MCLLTLLLVAVGGRTVLNWHESQARREIVYELSRKAYSAKEEDRMAAEQALRAMGPEAVTELARLLKAKDTRLRMSIRKAASSLPPKVRLKVNRHLPIRHGTTTRMLAARSLGLLGTNAAPAVPALAEAMHTTNNSVCWFAAEALGRAGPTALPPLVDACTAERDFLRHAALFGLGAMRSNALPAYSTIERSFADDVDYVRNSATHAAWSLGREVIPLLTNSLTHPEPRVRQQARKALTSFRTSAWDAVPLLQSQAKGMGPEELVDAIETIRKIWVFEPETVEWLVKQAEHQDEHVRVVALKTLSTLGKLPRPFTSSLRQHLDDADPEVRKAADFLVRILEAEPNPAQ